MDDAELFTNLAQIVGSFLLTGLFFIVCAVILVSLSIGVFGMMVTLGGKLRKEVRIGKLVKHIRRPSSNVSSPDSVGSAVEVAG